MLLEVIDSGFESSNKFTDRFLIDVKDIYFCGRLDRIIGLQTKLLVVKSIFINFIAFM